jgi:hypothetical protein
MKLSVHDTQQDKTPNIVLNVITLSVAFFCCYTE